jgi:hypothetical protein
MTFVLDTPDERGVPLSAHCQICGTTWTRPPGDDWADSLPVFARQHRESHDRQAAPEAGVPQTLDPVLREGTTAMKGRIINLKARRRPCHDHGELVTEVLGQANDLLDRLLKAIVDDDDTQDPVEREWEATRQAVVELVLRMSNAHGDNAEAASIGLPCCTLIYALYGTVALFEKDSWPRMMTLSAERVALYNCAWMLIDRAEQVINDPEEYFEPEVST